MNESCLSNEGVIHTWENHNCRTHEMYLKSRVWIRHILRMNESCLLNIWVMSFKRICHTHMRGSWWSHTWNAFQVTRLNTSCLSNVWVMSHIWFLVYQDWAYHVTRMNQSCLSNKWVMSHVWFLVYKDWAFHVTRWNTSCLSNELGMSHTWTKHGTQIISHVADILSFEQRLSISCHALE